MLRLMVELISPNLSKLENTLSTIRSSMKTVQSINSEIGVEQKKVSSAVYQQESLVSDVNLEALVSGRRTGWENWEKG